MRSPSMRRNLSAEGNEKSSQRGQHWSQRLLFTETEIGLHLLGSLRRESADCRAAGVLDQGLSSFYGFQDLTRIVLINANQSLK